MKELLSYTRCLTGRLKLHLHSDTPRSYLLRYSPGGVKVLTFDLNTLFTLAGLLPRKLSLLPMRKLLTDVLTAFARNLTKSCPNCNRAASVRSAFGTYIDAAHGIYAGPAVSRIFTSTNYSGVSILEVGESSHSPGVTPSSQGNKASYQPSSNFSYGPTSRLRDRSSWVTSRDRKLESGSRSGVPEWRLNSRPIGPGR